MYDIEEAIDRVMLSLEKRNRVMSAAEKERVAYHEARHALVALKNCLACQLPSAVWENYTEMRQHNNLGMRHGFREHRCLTERQFLTLAGDFREDWMTDKTLDPGTPIYRGRNSANRKCRSRWLFGTIGSCCAWVGLKIDDLSREQARTRSQFVHLSKSLLIQG